MLLERLRQHFDIMEKEDYLGKEKIIVHQILLLRPAHCPDCKRAVKRDWLPTRCIHELQCDNRVVPTYYQAPRYRCNRCKKRVLSPQEALLNEIMPKHMRYTMAANRRIGGDVIANYKSPPKEAYERNKIASFERRHKTTPGTVYNAMYGEEERRNEGRGPYDRYLHYVITHLEEYYYVFGAEEKNLYLLEVVPAETISGFLEKFFVDYKTKDCPRTHIIADFEYGLLDSINALCGRNILLSIRQSTLADYFSELESFDADADKDEQILPCWSPLELYLGPNSAADIDTSYFDVAIEKKIEEVKSRLARGEAPESILMAEIEKTK